MEAISAEPVPGKSVLEQLGAYAPLASLYFLTVGSLYLFGYWSKFNINILEYLSLSDIVKSTAYPIAATFLFFVAGAIAGEALGLGKKLPAGGGANTKLGKFLNRYNSIFEIAWLGIIIGILTSDSPNKWNLAAVLIAAPAYLAAKRAGLFASSIQSDSIRSVVIYVLAALPVYAFGQGHSAAIGILDGKRFDYILSKIEGVEPLPIALQSNLPRLIGHAGEFMFFYDPVQRATVIARLEKGQALVLKRYDAVVTPDGSAPAATAPSTTASSVPQVHSPPPP